MQAFCEAWCPITNTLITSAGELFISLWDLYKIGGFPIIGSPYEEVVPNIEELTGTYDKGRRFLPQTCEHLFDAFHRLQKGGSNDPKVSAKKWVEFWCRKTMKYTHPPLRKEKKSAYLKSTHNPTGVIEEAVNWSTVEEALFHKLGVMDDKKDETYLAAFLSCWLCIFVLPSKDGAFIRPGTFKIACHLACKRRVILAVPVLARIYKGLNEISKCSLLDPAQTCFPTHYVYGWLADYFKTHFSYAKGPAVPLMAACSGKGAARYFGKEEARKRIHNGENIIWTSIMPRRFDPYHYYDDGKADESKLNFCMSSRSNYLLLRDGVNFIIEPYSPHRFSRQFGFYQDTPGHLEQDFREASLEEGLRLARICVLTRSKSRAVFPPFGSNMKKFTSSNYRSWWARAHGRLLEDHLQFLMNTVELITNTIQDHNEDVLVIDKLPALQSKVVEMRAGNRPMLHKEVQREEIHTPIDKSLIPFGVVVDASNKRLSQEESDNIKGDQCWKKKRPNPEGVVKVQSVDSPSRTRTT
ncbi:uncharacterized protein LOC142163009 [Nicotiana tabacum]|uniref:Uncharacterized protein LOC142163009 n=1 Tax=Nicotiana tabacum TaxID=4097 RepID=A0AC58RUG1_TOBAC